ncbi:MAG TPA: putative peptidoglycan glycosyltransferase FtsW [Bacteroidota bacterium]|nr:putative peptidoglycan glycosyltransferase FtsW [Bacteroidota bacterium]
MQKDRNHIDIACFLAVLTLMVLSLGVVYSASSTWALDRLGESGKLLGSHAIKVLLGFVAIFVFMQVDYHRYRRVTKGALITAIGLLLVTLALGGRFKGATRWLLVGGFGLQPADFAKFALVFHLAVLVEAKGEKLSDLREGFLPMLVWIAAVTVLVLAQPNFSMGAMIFAISLVLLFLGRARLPHIALTLGALIPLLLAYMLSAPYRMQRIMSYMGQGSGEGSSSARHQLTQAIIGFGNGGLFGLGPGGSHQRDHFLPESYGDFVFAIVGEEYGLVGTLFFVLLFLVIFLRGMKIARHAHDELGRMLALGITCTITLYALVNACVTLGILPTTGLPMPFVSYGGSAMLFSCAAVGVLLNVSTQTDLHPRLAGGGVRPLQPARTGASGRS